jgi:uncharacterized surface protein with fasciclin (FAS1) repeats
MKKNVFTLIGKKMTLSLVLILSTFGLNAQTNVFDDVIATSPNHTYLEAALIQEGLNVALQNPAGTFTVFAPDDAAFTALATALGTDINGLLANPDLTNILLYHVLGAEVDSGSLTNGQLATPLNNANTVKVTLDGASVFINQAQVNTADLQADNGVVHSIGSVLLPVQTVADIALGSSAHTTLVAAVVEARLLPALTNPLSQLTVFAPTNDAFNAALTALGPDIAGVLAHPQLADILLYHVVGSEVLSTALINGPVATLNGQSVTVNLMSGVMINNANVILADLLSDNGVVHVIDAVLVPSLSSITEESSIKFEIYPNPTTEFLQIENVVEGDFEIKNISGTMVKSGRINGQPIVVSDLAKGNYFFIVNNASGTFQKRFVKN